MTTFDRSPARTTGRRAGRGRGSAWTGRPRRTATAAPGEARAGEQVADEHGQVAPTAKPSTTSRSVAAAFGPIVPSAQPLMSRAPTLSGGGSTNGFQSPMTTRSFQAMTKIAAAPSDAGDPDERAAASAVGPRAVMSSSASSSRTRAAVADAIAASRSARLRGWASGTGTSPTIRTGPAGEHEDPVGQEDRLGDGVGHEHDARRRLAPDVLRWTLNRSRVSASSALNGSSSSSTAGSSARRGRSRPAGASRRRAGAAGRGRRRAGRPGRAASRARASRRSRDQPASSSGKATLSTRGPPRQQARVLEHEPDARIRAGRSARPAIATLPSPA